MKIVGHRGARGLAPENTVQGLQKGLQHHADILEFDVRVTKDQVVVLHHDAVLTDPDGERHLINQSSYAVLKQHKPDLATLQEVLTQISPHTTLYIEVKTDEPVKPIIVLLQTHMQQGWDTNHLLLASKGYKTLMELHDALPEIPKVVIHAWSGIIATRRAKQVNTQYLAMNQRWLWGGFISSLSKRNWRLMAYTLNAPHKAGRWAKYGLYGVVTDYPDRFEQ